MGEPGATETGEAEGGQEREGAREKGRRGRGKGIEGGRGMPLGTFSATNTGQRPGKGCGRAKSCLCAAPVLLA